jgi:hypothetical protein
MKCALYVRGMTDHSVPLHRSDVRAQQLFRTYCNFGPNYLSEAA